MTVISVGQAAFIASIAAIFTGMVGHSIGVYRSTSTQQGQEAAVTAQETDFSITEIQKDSVFWIGNRNKSFYDTPTALKGGLMRITQKHRIGTITPITWNGTVVGLIVQVAVPMPEPGFTFGKEPKN